MEASEIHQLLNGYYSEKLEMHGPNFKGADWGSEEAQQISFLQLQKLLPSENFSLLDYGCGYGAFYDHLKSQGIKTDYSGYDISKEMIAHAKLLHQGEPAVWLSGVDEKANYDYVIACGIFSIKLNVSEPEWEKHVLKTLETLNKLSTKGFAFNSLTSYSDKPLMKDHLYYPDPCFLFDFCKKHFSKYVSLLHDYPKYEFTIIVRK